MDNSLVFTSRWRVDIVKESTSILEVCPMTIGANNAALENEVVDIQLARNLYSRYLVES